jgi:DNA polymerase-3 subunit beta
MSATAVATPLAAEKASDAPLMEVTVDRSQLLAEVMAAARVTDGKSTQPLLSHLLLRATGGGLLSITGSDLKRTMTTECPAAIKTFGEATVSAQKLLAYLKLLPAGNVSIKLLSNHQLLITAGRSRTRMPGLAPNSYPSSPSIAIAPLRLSCRGLKTLIRQSLFAVASSEDRYLFNAALLLLRQDRMGMVATDGRRLSLVEVQEDSLAIEGFKKVLLSRESMSDLLSLFNSGKDESVDFSEDESNFFFQIGPRILTVRKLIGQFPNYEAILPRDAMNSVVLGTSELLSSLQRILEFSDERSSAVKLHLDKNTLTVSASAADRGESEEILPLSYTADAVTIGFNGHFLVEFLKTIGGDGEVRLALKDGKSAAVITPEAFNPEYHQKYVVMPMRI